MLQRWVDGLLPPGSCHECFRYVLLRTCNELVTVKEGELNNNQEKKKKKEKEKKREYTSGKMRKTEQKKGEKN